MGKKVKSARQSKNKSVYQKPLPMMFSDDDDSDDAVSEFDEEDEDAAADGSNVRSPVLKDPMLNVNEDEGMDEEMNAMRQVFLRMTEKKRKQKEQRLADCKRMYTEAFEKDVKSYVAKFKRSRLRAVKEMKSNMVNCTMQLQEKTRGYIQQQKAYDTKFESDMKIAKQHLQQLRGAKDTLEDCYQSLCQKYKGLFRELEKKMEKYLKKQVTSKAHKIMNSTTFLESFQPQVQRLQRFS